MEPYEYRKMFDLEDRLWWYRGLRQYLIEALRRSGVTRDAVVLDAGCGTGANLALLTKTAGRAVGCDLAAESITFSAYRGLTRVLVADVNHLPFRSGAFDFVLSSDVFECGEVEPRRAAAELARVTKRGGRIVVTVSAYEFLSSEHDRAVHAVRRYSRATARHALTIPEAEIVGMRNLFGLFLAPIAAYRMLKRFVRDPRSVAEPQSDLFMPPRPINAALAAIARFEAVLSRYVRLPFGTTLLVELRRI